MGLTRISLCSFVPAVALCFSFFCCNHVQADDVSNNSIPGILYNPSTGLVQIDPDGSIITKALIVFRDRNTGNVGFNTNNYFDNSSSNLLFAANGGMIPDWDSADNGESIWGSSTTSGYSGNVSCWAQISSGLDSEDFLYASYNWDRPGGGMETNVSIVPEPATLSLLAIGGLGLLRRKGK